MNVSSCVWDDILVTVARPGDMLRSSALHLHFRVIRDPCSEGSDQSDSSQLLLLAAGTRTDTNGAANFTQQFTVNGQRGTATVFAMDGIDTTGPELGSATFSNFNVDAAFDARNFFDRRSIAQPGQAQYVPRPGVSQSRCVADQKHSRRPNSGRSSSTFLIS